jgi:hypothetical protein
LETKREEEDVIRVLQEEAEKQSKRKQGSDSEKIALSANRAQEKKQNLQFDQLESGLVLGLVLVQSRL